MLVHRLKLWFQRNIGFWTAYLIVAVYCSMWLAAMGSSPSRIRIEIPIYGKIDNFALFMLDLGFPFVCYLAWKSMRVRHLDLFLIGLPWGAYVVSHILIIFLLPLAIALSNANEGVLAFYSAEAVNLLKIVLALWIARVGYRHNPFWSARAASGTPSA